MLLYLIIYCFSFFKAEFELKEKENSLRQSHDKLHTPTVKVINVTPNQSPESKNQEVILLPRPLSSKSQAALHDQMIHLSHMSEPNSCNGNPIQPFCNEGGILIYFYSTSKNGVLFKFFSSLCFNSFYCR